MQDSERTAESAVYSEEVLARFRSPGYAGELQPGPGIGTGWAGSRRSGRLIRFQVALDSDGRIEQVVFKALGCPYTIATCALAAERATGNKPEAISGALEWAQFLTLPAARRDVALAVEDALQRAVAAARDEISGG